jgi:hypothetical protein
MLYLHVYLFILISQQADKNNESMYLGKIDASQHPEYTRLMSQLDQSKHDRLQKVQNWQKFERQSIHDWFVAQKKQAWDDFYVSTLFYTFAKMSYFCVILPLSNGETLSYFLIRVQRCTFLYLEKVSNICTFSLLEKRYAQILFKMYKIKSQD